MYCGSSVSMSREHVIGEWVGDFLGWRGSSVIINDTIDDNRREVIKSTQRSTRRRWGDAFIKTVCKKCNNTWLSEIQEKAKPIIRCLSDGVWNPLSLEDEISLAKWVTVTSFNASIYQREDPEFLKNHRKGFYENRLPPLFSTISAAMFSPASLYWSHRSLKTSAKINGEIVNLETVVTSIVIGNIIFFYKFIPKYFAIIDPVVYTRNRNLSLIYPNIPRLSGELNSKIIPENIVPIDHYREYEIVHEYPDHINKTNGFSEMVSDYGYSYTNNVERNLQNFKNHDLGAVLKKVYEYRQFSAQMSFFITCKNFSG